MLLDVSSQGTNGRCSQISLAGNAHVEFQSQRQLLKSYPIEPKFLDPYFSKFRQGIGVGTRNKIIFNILDPPPHNSNGVCPGLPPTTWFMVDLKPQKVSWTYF